ncbi:DUF3761 domain-containing protein [Salinarimonas soli]|uniref:DUF3761 domain-containing protein n=1 Tax=Salinarimonas soli TaxID=1638099 RepID=A0A5B2VFJ7_9HYPH|nr:DUF3761 domain-containing protein [Salinarimonas soli]KAA2236957.1 DUF3761 domain-containing protein [Salinarimonas soli]
MRVLAVSIIATSLLVSTWAGAREIRSRELIPGAPNVLELERKGSYQNRYGEDVQAPSRRIGGGVPEGATARCRDDTYSFSHSRSGTCSRHGGVSAWLR